MSTIILLSSSPPRIFARSPTPATATSSPHLPSPNALFRGDIEGRKRFKTAEVQRSGFGGGFTTAKAPLETKKGAENLPFKTQRCEEGSSEAGPAKRVAKLLDRKTIHRTKTERSLENDKKPTFKRSQAIDEPVKESSAPSESSRPIVEMQDQKKTPPRLGKEKDRNRSLSPLLLEKASSRRLDWTPPAATQKELTPTVGPPNPSVFFSGSLLGSFGYKTSTNLPALPPNPEDEYSTKRRKIELAETGASKASESMLASELKPKPRAKSSKKRTISPAKKYTTITGLATSLYSNNKPEEPTPMMQFLSASQAGAVDDDDKPQPDTAKPKPKRAPRKTKKVAPKFKVLSPQSALKASAGQEVIFGSASQLARDESPTFTRDTLEALKLSESQLLSDPVSTQMTQPISIASTMSKSCNGTARFARNRNLWSAAGRDEDNALLHVDTVDLFDTPSVRMAFAGKDVLLEPGVAWQRETRSPEKLSPSLRGSYLPATRSPSGFCYDIDDITTPTSRRSLGEAALQIRGLHTTAQRSSPQKALAVQPEPSFPDKPARKTTPKAKRPVKPSYTGYTTSDLQKQISAFGFKPIKKREKMIEILERCWEDQHGPDGDMAQEHVVEAPKHADFLSKVHDISARVEPKQKKVTGRAKKDKTDPPANPSPKKRKKAEPKSKPDGVKAVWKRKSNATVLSAERVLDVDDLEDQVLELAEAVLGREVKPTEDSAVESTIVRQAACVTTIPPSLPVVVLSSPPAQIDDVQVKPTFLAAPFAAPQPDINAQITRAITSFVPAPEKNHQHDPTWHEKILMYDPIVLEDLAAWLNTEGLGRIGEDREVSAFEVRAWCEERGVCCLWRGGWRGNKRKGLGGGDDGGD